MALCQSTSGPIVVCANSQRHPSLGNGSGELLGHVGSTSQDPDRDLTQSVAAAGPAGVVVEPRFQVGPKHLDRHDRRIAAGMAPAVMGQLGHPPPEIAPARMKTSDANR